MNLDQITSQGFILALFIRDDGERFLLGSGAYEFNKKQLHFTANSYANDIIEVQGNDGVFLAGQVRRATTQSFDGYIGDVTVPRTTIENYRKDFITFFRKNFYYKVVYVFNDGTAIQRQKGFIVDAPEVKELYQKFPEYHIGMNFEDVNYYTYLEDSGGNEIYGKNAVIPLSAGSTDGGLIWGGMVSTTITKSGTSFGFSGYTNIMTIDSVQIKGNTTQQTYSGKNLAIYPYQSGSSRTNNGITFTSDSDGIITINNQNNGNGHSSYYIYNNSSSPMTFLPGTYYFIPPVNTHIEYVFYNGSSYYSMDSSNNYSLTFSTTQSMRQIYVQIRKNDTTVFDNLKIYPMLSTYSSQTEEDYEPYVGGIASPNPDYPQTINVVTGEQTITVSDGDNNSDTYTVDLGSVELCRISGYQDEIYKSGGNWYVYKEVGKYILDGQESFGRLAFTGVSGWHYYYTDEIDAAIKTGTSSAFSNNFSTVASIVSGEQLRPGLFQDNPSLPVGSYMSISKYNAGDTNILRFSMPDSVISSADDFKTWLANNETVIYYSLNTPTTTQITDATLITQLEALAGADCYDKQTTFTVTASSLQGILSVEATYDGGSGAEWDSIGAVWEAGGGGGPTTIMVDSIDNVYPVWEVKGPAVNPQISVLTTGTTLSYTGTVTATQTLKIDMFNKTALLNGTSVIGNVSGDWIYLNQGNNRVTYTTDNATADSSTIYWQEIVG